MWLCPLKRIPSGAASALAALEGRSSPSGGPYGHQIQTESAAHLALSPCTEHSVICPKVPVRISSKK
jgi:hypothetical protein